MNKLAMDEETAVGSNVIGLSGDMALNAGLSKKSQQRLKKKLEQQKKEEEEQRLLMDKIAQEKKEIKAIQEKEERDRKA